MDTIVKPGKLSESWSWVLKMAWKDSRRNRARLFIFILSIALGIGALVGINSFKTTLVDEIDSQAKELLGADMAIGGQSKSFVEDAYKMTDSIPGEKSYESSFASMVFFPRTDGTRLVNVRSLKGGYPYYGKIETEPVEAAEKFKTGQYALVDESVMLQYNVQVGDQVKVGNTLFEIVGKLQKVPGQTEIGTTVAPIVYIPLDYLGGTGLMKKGSRIQQTVFFKIPDQELVEEMNQKYGGPLDKMGIYIETVEDRKRDAGRAFGDLADFLNLVAFVALLLGCIGVSSSVYVYIKEKIKTVAVLRCLGASSNQVFFIFLFQIALFGIIGSLLGASFGVMLQSYLPSLLKDFIPVQITSAISWISVGQGIMLGLFISVLFTLLPLLKIRKITPLGVIRDAVNQTSSGGKTLPIIIYSIIFLFIWIFSRIQINDWLQSLYFSLGIVVAFLLLTGSGKLVMWLVRRFFPKSLGFVWRQGLANLYRPNNQTLTLIVTIGLGTMLIASLYSLQELLVKQITISGEGERPNMVLFDIQTPQMEEVKEITLDYDMPVMQEVPIVTMRMMEINGYSKNDVVNDSTLGYKKWSFNREYRVTYRDKLITSETIVDGKWIGTATNNDSIFISISKGFAESINANIGDELVFNVQGALIKTYVGSFREIEWNRVQTNFLVLFPKGVLEEAPQFNVLITKTNSADYAARYQQAIVRNFPNISIIDLGLILNTLEEVLGRISFVIRFMALFSIATGLLVLLSSVITSKYQRIEENVLLRTLGASKNQIWKILFTEYFMLGSIASIAGLLISMIGSWLLASFVFEITYLPNYLAIFSVFIIITSLTIIIGLLNSRSVINNPPLQVIRKEV